MVGDNKEVFFDVYCPQCAHKGISESDPEGACWDCLESPVNVDSHKPVNFKEASENEKRASSKGNEEHCNQQNCR
jgi:hypothetical protein